MSNPLILNACECGGGGFKLPRIPICTTCGQLAIFADDLFVARFPNTEEGIYKAEALSTALRVLAQGDALLRSRFAAGVILLCQDESDD